MTDSIGLLESLYREHGPALMRYLARAYADVGSAEDLLQDTFVQALAHTDRLARAVSPRAWLFAVARNVAISALRRRRRTERLPEGLAAPTPDGEDARLEQMRRAIDRLPDVHREVLGLRLAEQLNYAEIAEVLGIPIGTVRSRLHNAMSQLREAVPTGRQALARGDQTPGDRTDEPKIDAARDGENDG